MKECLLILMLVMCMGCHTNEDLNREFDLVEKQLETSSFEAANNRLEDLPLLL